MGNSKSKSKKTNNIPIIIYNLKGREIQKITDGYYDLGTNRKNKNPKPELLVDETYRVMGNKYELQAFYEINHIFNDSVCSTNTNNVIYAPNIDDVSKLPEQYLNNLCPFNLSGLQSKARVVNVLDGDTWDIVVYLNLSFLFTPRYYARERKNSAEVKDSSEYYKQVSILQSSDPKSKKIQEGGLFIMLNCRLMGVDAAESKTPQGQLATELTIKKLESLNNIIYVNLLGPDKYGRTLIDCFEDSNRTKYLNFYLIDYMDPKLGRIAEKYNGGSKSTYMKELPSN